MSFFGECESCLQLYQVKPYFDELFVSRLNGRLVLLRRLSGGCETACRACALVGGAAAPPPPWPGSLGWCSAPRGGWLRPGPPLLVRLPRAPRSSVACARGARRYAGLLRRPPLRSGSPVGGAARPSRRLAGACGVCRWLVRPPRCAFAALALPVGAPGWAGPPPGPWSGACRWLVPAAPPRPAAAGGLRPPPPGGSRRRRPPSLRLVLLLLVSASVGLVPSPLPPPPPGAGE